MQPTTPVSFANSLRRTLLLSLLLTLAALASGCSRLQGLSAASGVRGGACDQGLLAVGAWKCLSGLQTANLSALPVAGPARGAAGLAGETGAVLGGGAAAGTVRR